MSINSQLDVAAVLDVHRNFLPEPGRSLCNIYACAFLGMRGHVIPIMTANDLHEWFTSPRAMGDGWRKATHAEAFAAANAGGDVVAVVRGSPHGHIGIVVESLPNTPGRMCVSAAGATNFVRAPIERSFGSLKPTFFLNV